MASGCKSLAIKIGDRYFYKWGKNHRVLTAWSIAGAKQFDVLRYEDRVLSIVNSLKRLKKSPITVVGIEETITIIQSVYDVSDTH